MADVDSASAAAQPGQPPPSAKKRRRPKTEQAERVAKFRRGEPLATRKIADKKLRGELRHSEQLAAEAARSAAKVDEWLLPPAAGSLEAEGLERTWRFRQEDIVAEAEVGAARKVVDLSLPQLGPYAADFSRSGRWLLLGGRRGHLALLDWQRAAPACEVQVRETVRDVKLLHNEQFFAAAQRKYVYIYDRRGIEVHCLREHTEVNVLDFLPHHFLLVSIGRQGVLRYQDTSTGQVVAQHRTKLGPCAVMRHNPWNAVEVLGHANGTVTMWTPNLTQPAVRMLVHRGPVSAVAVDADGRHLVTAGSDGQVKVWDVRTFKPLHAYFARRPAERLSISQNGLLAVGAGRRIQVWKDALTAKAQSPYMTHTLPAGGLAGLAFCPYEDVLAAGHQGGLSTALVPGAGEAHYDSLVADPFQGRRARREAEVVQLLDKLQPHLIVLDPASVGQVRREPAEALRERAEAEAAANAVRRREQEAVNAARQPMKGKNKPSRRHRKKQNNIIDERRGDVKARMREQGVSAEHGGAPRSRGAASQPPPAERAPDVVPDGVPRALHRFYKRAPR